MPGKNFNVIHASQVKTIKKALQLSYDYFKDVARAQQEGVLVPQAKPIMPTFIAVSDALQVCNDVEATLVPRG